MASGLGQMRIDDAIRTLNTGGIKNRADGLSNILTIFKTPRQNTAVTILKDGGYHSIFEALFQAATEEKRTYLAGKTEAAKTRAERTLAQISEALRITIRAGAEKLKPKTVRAVIHHVIGLLPFGNGDYDQPFTQAYLKVLNTILEHDAHVELLEEDDWVRVVQFCIQGITHQEVDSSGASLSRQNSFAPSMTPVSTARRGLPRSSSSLNNLSVIKKRNAEELMGCLRFLVSASNAPVLGTPHTILDAIVHFLNSQGHIIGHFHQVAFSALNAMLFAASADEISLTTSLAHKVLPLIAQLWSSKTAANDEMLNVSKDEMAISILLLRLQIKSIVAEGGFPGLENILKDVQQALRGDYERRAERDQLQLDDLIMTSDASGKSFSRLLPCGNLWLQPYSIKTERKWVTVQALAIVDDLLYGNKPKLNAEDEDEAELNGSLHSRKRRRKARRFDALIDHIKLDSSEGRLVALQTLLFAVPDSSLSEDEIEHILTQLSPYVLDRNANISCWAMLCCSALAPQAGLLGQSNTDAWKQLWSTVSRAMTSLILCRSACHLLHTILATQCVEFKDVSENATAMLTMPEINAPAVLSDASIGLMRHLLQMKNSEGSGGAINTSHITVRWLFGNWNPDKGSAPRSSALAQPIDVLNMLRTILDLPPVQMSVEINAPGGIIRQAWLRHTKMEGTLRFLLLLDDAPTSHSRCSSCAPTAMFYRGKQSADALPHGQGAKRLVIDLLHPKAEALKVEWESQSSASSSQASYDPTKACVNACLTIALLLPLVEDITSAKKDDIVTALHAISLGLSVLNSIDAKVKTESILYAVQPYLPRATSIEVKHLYASCVELSMLFCTLANAIKELATQEEELSKIDDLMHLDDFDSQHTRSSGKNNDRFERKEMQLMFSQSTFIQDTTSKLLLIVGFEELKGETLSVPGSVVYYINELTPANLLSSKEAIMEFLQGGMNLDPLDAKTLFNCAAALINMQCSSCEVVLIFCIDMLNGLLSSWVSAGPDGGDVVEMAEELYTWFVKDVLPKRRPSVAVQIHASNLVYGMIHKNPLFLVKGDVDEEDLSVKTTLFNILHKAPILVKFSIARRLPDIFSLFTLKTHLGILNDLLRNLPIDPEWMEGNAFRLFILSGLAATWPTLLRICAYYMLEVAGRVPESIAYATISVKAVSKALNLKDEKELFRLFSSQFLFTWLTDETFDTLPYNIFGYIALTELLQDSQEEITALMVMRDRDEEVERLASSLNLSVVDLLKSSFTRVLAYSIAHDISVAPTPSNSSQKYVTGEVRVRKRLGTDRFSILINTHFVDIISTFFKTMDHEHDLERTFAKHRSLEQAAEALAQMKASSSPDTTLTPNQQPNFKAKCLVREIEHLCSRTEFELPTLFKPALIVSVARSLLDSMNPAIGSLHDCGVLRKLRVLIAMAGPMALTGYPLQMLLQSLRPLLLDAHCADDAIGVAQYLIENSAEYLATVPSFVASIALSMLGSIRVLIGKGPSTTTQASEYAETMSKVESYQTNLCSFLANYDPVELKQEMKTSERAKRNYAVFQQIIEQARKLGHPGPANDGTVEGDLLVAILRDKRMATSILPRPARKLALSLVYKNFQPPTSYRSDPFGEDDRAIRYAPELWDICKYESGNSALVTWAASVLGRAFAASGYIEPSLLQETGLGDMRDLVELHPSITPSSRVSVLSLIKSLTVVDYHGTTGHSERALRRIATTIAEKEDNPDEAHLSAALAGSLIESSRWFPFHVPPSDLLVSRVPAPKDPFLPSAITEDDWLERLSIHLVQSVPSDPILYPMQQLLSSAAGFAEACFPFILHIVLLQQLDESLTVKKQLSTAMRYWLTNEDAKVMERVRLLINAMLYLRTQPLPRENSHADRTQWLDLDYRHTAEAAVRCKMFKTALLLTEITSAETPRVSRKSSMITVADPKDILVSIFRNLDDPDIFYGLRQTANLQTLSARLEFERNGLKTLMFRGAEYDTRMRRAIEPPATEAHGLVKALGMLSLDGLSHSMLQTQQATIINEEVLHSMYQTARKLEQWDLPISDTYDGDVVTIYKTFQTLSTVADRASAKVAVDTGILSSISKLLSVRSGAAPVHASLQTLAVLNEIDEVISTSNSEEFEQILHKFEGRSTWMKTGRYEDVSQIISCRETTLSCLSQQPSLRKIIDVSTSDTRLVEARVSLLSSGINRVHGALQESLTTATYINSLISPCRDLGLNIEAAAGLEVANAMWDQGEISSSIGVLKELQNMPSLKQQTIPVNKAVVLAKLASQISEAKLEKPDRIMGRYLTSAFGELKGKTSGEDAGHVFRTFAIFCDRQYHDQDAVEDFERLRIMKENKEAEVSALKAILREGKAKKDQGDVKAFNTARNWLNLDREEYERLEEERIELLHNSLENYLRSLKAWDGHDNDTIRFAALWLEHSGEEVASEAVSPHLLDIPTYKFAGLSNQLTSRLLDNPDDPFQELLFALVVKICTDHPYHGMYQVWSGQNTAPKAEDEIALSRHKATSNVGKELSRNATSKVIWEGIDNLNLAYCQFAAEKDKYRMGAKYKVGSSVAANKLNRGMRSYRLPPPTMQIGLRKNRDYADLPTMMKLDATFSIANGLSAPKIMTVLGSDGRRYKQLTKGGTDDLRQDAIMEQVFAQVSELLKENSATRQRNLSIRTYKVMPLSTTAGIIEFVPNTIPLTEFLNPAHEKYYPRDIKASQARKEISDAQHSKLEVRCKKYISVTERFHPVMRYFHLERFPDPDEWFAKRQAYTRSTAAISMLGYVLGLGDRHGHNILLDEVTGEVVHIDLGVAFEGGRVLPVPELVPFRLTRDIVDGMGITKTEGVFRRCCEFTLDALRKEADTIMTILDVLRYDPLYNWSISPIRLAKLQEVQNAMAPPISTAGSTATTTSGVGPGLGGAKERGNEPGEADRALTVVKKKLSKGLSVTAMVHDLINQASDEKHLAVLFSGWGAYY